MKVREFNKRAYTDILQDFAKHKGEFAFTLKVHSGNVIEYELVEVVQYKNGRKNNTTIL